MENKPMEGKTITPQSLITEDQVKKALLADKGKDVDLISWNVVDFTKPGDNYASVVTSVEVKYSINKQTYNVTYVVKLNPCRNFEGFEDINDVIFLKEGKFYQNLLPELNSVLEVTGKEPLRFPECYHVSLESGKEQIYFDDLRVKGFKMFDRRKGMDKDHAILVLKELARLHAASYLLQSKTPDEPLEIKHDYLLKDWLTFTEKCKDYVIPMMQGHLTHAVKMLKKVGGYEKAISWIESLHPKLEYFLSSDFMKSDRFGCISHGDCWNNNTLFRYNDEGKPLEVMLLDLQMCRKVSLAIDLNYFLFTSLTGDVRKPNLDNFMSTYHTSFQDVLESRNSPMYFTEKELLDEFRDKNTLGAFFGMTIIPSLLMESKEIPDMSGEVEDLKELIQDFYNKALEMLDSNPMLKPRFLSIFDELMETGLIS